MAIELKDIKSQLKAMKITFDPKGDRNTLITTYLDACDAAIAAAGGPENAATALTEEQIVMFNDLIAETEGGDEDASPDTEAAQESAEMGNVATEGGEAGAESDPTENDPKKPNSGSKKKGKQGNTPKEEKTPRGTKVDKVATPVGGTPREVRRVYDRIASLMDVLKEGGGTEEEIVVEANEKYVRQGGKSNPKESNFYWRIVKKTLQHLGLVIQGEDKIVTIRQER